MYEAVFGLRRADKDLDGPGAHPRRQHADSHGRQRLSLLRIHSLTDYRRHLVGPALPAQVDRTASQRSHSDSFEFIPDSSHPRALPPGRTCTISGSAPLRCVCMRVRACLRSCVRACVRMQIRSIDRAIGLADLFVCARARHLVRVVAVGGMGRGDGGSAAACSSPTGT